MRRPGRHRRRLSALTGRIVDQANIIPAAARNALEQKLTDLEAKSGIQLVVATVPSLGGEETEPYANELFHVWKLGEKTKNNGVLLLVAPTERRVRIEVGYGLEGTLTDALSKVIIANAIAPRFQEGDFGGGITRGVDDIIAVLTTDASEWPAAPVATARQSTVPGPGGLAPHGGSDRSACDACRFAAVTLALSQRAVEHPGQLRPFGRWRVLARRVCWWRVFRRRVVGRRSLALIVRLDQRPKIARNRV